MKTRICFFLLVLPMFNCSEKKPFAVTLPANPSFVENTVFHSFEDLSDPKFKQLREKYQLDTIFHGEADEFTHMLLLRDWIRKVVQISDFEETYPGDDYAENILDHSLKGQGYHCGHYMIVQNAVMNSYGYVTRCLGAGPGVKGGPDGHHGINEIWSNKFQKWFLSDAKYNHHFEKNGIPLSALEIRDEYLMNKAVDIVLVKSADRTVIDADGVKNAKGKMIQISKERFAQTYTWIEWEATNNRFTHWPDNSHDIGQLNMLADDYFKTHTWIWDGKPHWAYNTTSMIQVTDRQAMEWTPNTISADVTVDGNDVSFVLRSNTPNLKSYQLKGAEDQEWKDIPERMTLFLVNDENELSFRTLNVANVPGPAYEMVIKR